MVTIRVIGKYNEWLFSRVFIEWELKENIILVKLFFVVGLTRESECMKKRKKEEKQEKRERERERSDTMIACIKAEQ